MKKFIEDHDEAISNVLKKLIKDDPHRNKLFSCYLSRGKMFPEMKQKLVRYKAQAIIEVQNSLGQASETTKEVEKSTKECCICMERDATHLADNCGHQCVCEKCSLMVTKCPECRTVTTKWIKVFY